MTKHQNDFAALEAMPPAQLFSLWAETFDVAAPPVPDSMLRRALAHALQEKALGGLSAPARRSLEALAGGGSAAVTELAIKLKPGTRLMRQWNGRMHSVVVTTEGFEFDGKIWKSLSAIAERVTGAHWSGPRFFGLKRPQLPPLRTARDGQ